MSEKQWGNKKTPQKKRMFFKPCKSRLRTTNNELRTFHSPFKASRLDSAQAVQNHVFKTPSNTLIFAHSFINFCSDCPNLSSYFVEFAMGDPAFSLKNKCALFFPLSASFTSFSITSYAKMSKRKLLSPCPLCHFFSKHPQISS